MIVAEATNQREWDTFLSGQRFRPFLQSWTMGEVYRSIGEEPLRLVLRDGTEMAGICQAIVVPARRGKHLAILYGPVLRTHDKESIALLIAELSHRAKESGCSFIRMSPFWPSTEHPDGLPSTKPSPLHLLAEHIWYLPLTQVDAWKAAKPDALVPKSEEELLSNMRKTTRNLIRRAEREGVVVMRSDDPERDLETFIALHEETRRRHRFTPYTNAFFRAQVMRFAERNECTLYLAHYNSRVVAASIHVHMAGETSYHHGASSHEFAKIPSSYLLQWTAIKDALARGDHIYNFWGIAPLSGDAESATPDPRHPFAGVTLFKRGFGGDLLSIVRCMDVPLRSGYYATRAFEALRKWKRGF